MLEEEMKQRKAVGYQPYGKLPQTDKNALNNPAGQSSLGSNFSHKAVPQASGRNRMQKKRGY